MKVKYVEIQVASRESHPVRIVADAAVSTRGMHGGRLLPLVLLDTSSRPDIEQLIRLHQTMGPGDAETQWGKIKGNEETVALFLSFIRPVELFMFLEFDIVKQGILVEQILTGQGIYLAKADRDDDRLMYDPDRPKVVVEVGDTGYRKTWDGLFHKHLAKDFREKGMSRSDARRAARSAIEELRKFGSLRMPDVLE